MSANVKIWLLLILAQITISLLARENIYPYPDPMIVFYVPVAMLSSIIPMIATSGGSGWSTLPFLTIFGWGLVISLMLVVYYYLAKIVCFLFKLNKGES